MRRVIQQHCCDHDYTIIGMSGAHVSFRCVKCQKEIYLPISMAPKELLKWGYSWYHGDTQDGVLELLINQPIQKNNELKIPMRCTYIVSLLEKLDVAEYEDGHGRRVDFGDIHVRGMYFERNKAEDALEYNVANILKERYPFACIECFGEGNQNCRERIRFFKQEDQKNGAGYVEFVPESAAVNNIRTVAMGIS